MKCISTSVRASALRASASTSAYGSEPTCAMEIVSPERICRTASSADRSLPEKRSFQFICYILSSSSGFVKSQIYHSILFFSEQFFSIKNQPMKKAQPIKNCAIASLFLYRLKNISPPVRRKPANRPDLPVRPLLHKSYQSRRPDLQQWRFPSSLLQPSAEAGSS